jgi:hypothetical protein
MFAAAGCLKVGKWRFSDKERSPKTPPVTAAFWPIASIVEIRDFRESGSSRSIIPASANFGN